jgi:hypothetical protein
VPSRSESHNYHADCSWTDKVNSDTLLEEGEKCPRDLAPLLASKT